MPCPSAMDQQANMLKLIHQVNRYQVKAGELILSDGSADNQLVYKPFQPASLPLEGTDWVLMYFTESDAVTDTATSVSGDQPLTLRIESETAKGSAGVNEFTCDVTLKADSSLLFRGLSASEIAGTPEAMKQEQRYFETLQTMKKYSIRENRLTLSDEQGSRGMQFESVPLPHREGK